MDHSKGKNEKELSEKTSEKERLTRRQFLTYALGGTGAFMGAVIAAPLVTTAFDPVIRQEDTGFSKTDWKVSDFNYDLPKHVSYKEEVVDAWNKQVRTNDVYVIKYQKKLMVMSHVCTHLGCHVNGSEKNGKSVPPEYNSGKDWFLCPCHGSLFDKYGVQTPNSPAQRPLDLYYYKVDKDGTVHVGKSFRRSDANWQHNPNPLIE